AGNVAVSEWTGTEGLAISLSILVDGFTPPRRVVEREYRRIIRLGRKRNGSEAPPPFRVVGDAFPFSGTRFVLESTPEFSGPILNNRGEHLRFSAVLPLREYVTADRVKIGLKPRYRKIYTVKKGDT